MKIPTKKEILETVANGLKDKDLSKETAQVLKRSVDEVLKRIRQNMDAQIKEDSSPIIEDFCKNIGNKLLNISQKWVNVANESVVFPENTRYIHRDGNSTTIVIEQQPQVRTIQIDLNRGSRTYNLAFPYCQFIIPFVDNKLAGVVYMGMSKKPLSDLDAMIYNPPMPNIENHKICMGDFQFPKTGSMTEKVNAIIGGFWQSTFNNNHMAAVQKFLTDNVLTFESWQERSKLNSSFILNKEIVFSAGRTVRGLLQASDSGSVALINNMRNEINTAIGSIGLELQKLLNIDVTTENRTKTHLEVLEGVLKELIEAVYAELYEYQQMQINEEKAKLQVEMEAMAVRLKNDFKAFMESKSKDLRR